MTISFNNNMKPSELVLVFRDVMDIAINSGCKMDLFEWESLNGNLPCLGGLACMEAGLNRKTVDEGLIADLGDALRKGDGRLVISTINNYLRLIGDNQLSNILPQNKHYYGVIDVKEMKYIRSRCINYANKLKKVGR